MTKLILALAAAAAIAAPASADTPLQFERNGVTYVGRVIERHGSQHIIGRELVSGRAFDLDVVHGRVSGTYDGNPVSYIIPTTAYALATASR